jgi:hypothetical protein
MIAIAAAAASFARNRGRPATTSMYATPIARIAVAPIGIDGAAYPSQLAS